jgi:hypothetical protein
MTDVDFTKDMTAEEVAAAREAGAYARKRLSGGTLLEDLKMGEQLLMGSALVMKKYDLKVDRGQPYNNLFASWRRQFGFPESNDPDEQKGIDDLYVDAKYCAKHIEAAREIIAAEPPKWRASVGVGAVAKRVRERFKAERAAALKEAAPDAEADAGKEPREKKVSAEVRLQGDNAQLRTDLIAERAAHAKTKRDLDAALRNPLMHWQVSPNEAAVRLHGDSPARGRLIMAALIALNTPAEKASVPAAKTGEGRCEQCGSAMSLNRAGKRFCSITCQRAASHARKKAAKVEAVG